MNPLIQLKTTPPLLIILTLLLIAPLPNAQAVVPAPDGGYPEFTTAEGTQALQSLTSGAGNTGVGWRALFADTTGSFNTGLGAGALLLNTADSNTAVGAAALLLNTTGAGNTATGASALLSNTTGLNNTATGSLALSSNTGGSDNTAVGGGALQSNVDGTGNTAVGALALANENATGGFPYGVSNNAIGSNALFTNTTGSFNQAMGVNALFSNTTGSLNIAIGDDAGLNQTTGSGNVYIGVNVPGVAGENDACYIASIFSQTSANGIPVLINSNNKLGTTTSSKRFKEDIKPMDKASEALFALKPVRFRYKKEIDPASTSQFGLVAEDVEKVNPDLIVRDKDGKPYTVRYDAVNAMLLNEFLKARRQIDAQQKQIDALTAGLQKVSAQLEASKPAPQVVGNP